jgi:hypothetical protein
VLSRSWYEHISLELEPTEKCLFNIFCRLQYMFHLTHYSLSLSLSRFLDMLWSQCTLVEPALSCGVSHAKPLLSLTHTHIHTRTFTHMSSNDWESHPLSFSSLVLLERKAMVANQTDEMRKAVAEKKPRRLPSSSTYYLQKKEVGLTIKLMDVVVYFGTKMLSIYYSLVRLSRSNW